MILRFTSSGSKRQPFLVFTIITHDCATQQNRVRSWGNTRYKTGYFVCAHAHQPFLVFKAKLMNPTIPNWHLPLPDYVLQQYELMFAHPCARNIQHLTELKAECIRQEYYTYLSQLRKLELVYGIDIPLPHSYRTAAVAQD